MRAFCHRYRDWLLLALALLSCVAALLSVYLLHVTISQQRDICLRVERNKDQIRKTIRQGLDRAPTLSYYRNRPEELAQTLADGKKQLRHFSPEDC